VDRRRGGRGAVGVPFLEFLQVIRTLRSAGTIIRDIESVELGHTVFLHADLREKILAHRAILAVFDANLPVCNCVVLADINVCNQDAECSLGEDLKVAEEAEINLLAVLEEGTRRRTGIM